MERVRWEEHKGKKILILDYSGLKAGNPEEKRQILDVIAKAWEITEKKEGKILFLSYVANSSADNEIMAKLKEFASFANGSGKVDKECVVGISPIQKIFINTINMFSKAKLVVFNGMEEAKEWLTA
jgi:hypothetical protein